MRDKALKGRAPAYRGYEHPSAKLTDDDICEIRSRYKGGTARGDIAAAFGISISYLDKITQHQVRRLIEKQEGGE